MAYALEPSRTTKGEDSSGGSQLRETTFLKRLMVVVSIKEADLMCHVVTRFSLQRDITGLLREVVKNEESTRWQMKYVSSLASYGMYPIGVLTVVLVG